MTEFKVGDRVRLTGADWYGGSGEPEKGDIVEITRVDSTGFAWFEWSGEKWFIEDGGYDAELVTDAPTYADVEDSARDYDAVISNITPHFDHIGQDFGLVSAIDPGHYKFPGGVEVIDITRHMDFLTGNAVKYLTRAGRKGDRLEDLKKAARYVQWAIEDAEAAE